MDNLPEIHAAFSRFCDLGEKHAFRTRSGRHFLGWALEVGEDSVLVDWAPSPFYAQATGSAEMSPPEEWIRFADIDLGSLAYWDEATRGWVEFRG